VTDVVVVGGGAAGLGTALALARTGRAVTVLERDDASLPASADEAFSAWPRRGAPQVHHSHAFLARLRCLLAARAPDLLAELLNQGAAEWRFCEHVPASVVGFEPRPDDEDLVALACRRTTFEWVLRRAAGAEPLITLRGSCPVLGLEVSAGRHVPRVVGVRTTGKEVVLGDLVVDAGGRNSALPAWLAEAGAASPHQRESDIGILYGSRFYRLRDSADVPESEGVVGGDLGYMKYGVFPADRGTFSITLAVPTDDAELRAVLRDGPFDALAAALPTTGDWLAGDRAEPISDVTVMARLRNRLRRVVVDGAPVATGIVLLGDAAVCTNPLYGRGTALALVHAYLLADTLADRSASRGVGLDLAALAVAFDDVTRAELEPWYRASVFQDEQDLGARRASAAGDEGPAKTLAAMRAALFSAVRTDPDVWRAFVRTFNLLDPPESMLTNPAVAAKVAETLQATADGSADAGEAPAAGPTRDETLRIAAAAA
jgi:2-polyprenyl-6-methoxyphenol hydroxylase-like FAD-dependent oxidoreductase